MTLRDEIDKILYYNKQSICQGFRSTAINEILQEFERLANKNTLKDLKKELKK